MGRAVIVLIYFLLSIATSIAQFAFVCWAATAITRVLRSKDGPYLDALRGAIGLLVLNGLWYQMRPFVFGAHLDTQSPPEILWRLLALAWTVVSIHIVFRTLQKYESVEAASRRQMLEPHDAAGG